MTLRRTAAASALAARLLARADARTLAVCGRGDQGRAHLVALAPLFPLARVFAWDADAAAAERFAQEMRASTGLAVEPARELAAATARADLIVTCTSARRPFLGRDHVQRGAFIAAVGADNPEKSEVEPGLLASAKLVVDVLAQCAVMGDLHHALAAGAMAQTDVYAELAQLVTGQRAGRTRDDEILVFDSTGTAIEDAASAAFIYERAQQTDAGTMVALAAD